MNSANPTPDMVKYAEVVGVITTCAAVFKNEKEMAKLLQMINNLSRYDLKPVPDNISNTTVNLIAESGKVRELIEKMKDKM